MSTYFLVHHFIELNNSIVTKTDVVKNYIIVSALHYNKLTYLLDNNEVELHTFVRLISSTSWAKYTTTQHWLGEIYYNSALAGRNILQLSFTIKSRSKS